MHARPAHLHLRRELRAAPSVGALPREVSEVYWHERHARAVHDLLVRSYRAGEGDVAPYERWLPALVGDSEFDAGSCFLLLQDDALIAVALCWSSAFIKDLCVTEEQRRRGLGSYLLLRACSHFASRGAPAVALKVATANTNARRLYARHGFVFVPES